MDVVLEALSVARSFGGIGAVRDVSVRIASGEIVGIIGANGAGKTTFVNLVTGYLRPDHGDIRYLGRSIVGRSPQEVTRRGIARSFQVPQLYLRLSALENLLLALAAQTETSGAFWAPLARPDRVLEARELLARFGIARYETAPARTLPEGPRKVLDVALAFALRPRVLLLDEPTSGVSNAEKTAVMDSLVGVLREARVTAVFIEHDMDVVQRYAERVLAFAAGRIVADGAPSAVLADPDVRREVLGA